MTDHPPLHLLEDTPDAETYGNRVNPSLWAAFLVFQHLRFVGRAVDLVEGFDDISDLPSKDWNFQNLSDPLGTTNWFQDVPGNFDAQAGPNDSCLSANFNIVDGSGTISDWAITPTRTYENGDTFSFYTRTGTDSTFADRLQIRMSTNGSSTNVGVTAESVGDFTDLLLDINSTLVGDGYPQTWTQYVITVSGLGGPTIGRIAFRYYVTDGGPDGSNSNLIGIDTLQITSVPEPSTWALATIGTGMLVFARRRGKRERS